MNIISERLGIEIKKCDCETGFVEYVEIWRDTDFETGKIIKKYVEECEDEIYDLQACLNLDYCDTDIYDTRKKQERWWKKEFAPDFLMGYYINL